jgi:hypothetical protein
MGHFGYLGDRKIVPLGARKKKGEKLEWRFSHYFPNLQVGIGDARTYHKESRKQIRAPVEGTI